MLDRHIRLLCLLSRDIPADFYTLMMDLGCTVTEVYNSITAIRGRGVGLIVNNKTVSVHPDSWERVKAMTEEFVALEV